MDAQHITDILRRYRMNQCSPQEIQLVNDWYRELLNTGELHWEAGEKELLQQAMEHRLLQRIAEPVTPVLSINRAPVWKRKSWWAAAAILIVLTGGAYFLLNRKPKQPAVATTNKGIKQDVAPGGNKAVLTLANGSSIMLDDAANGTLAQEGNYKVVKLSNGQLKYTRVDATGKPVDNNTPVGFNTLATPAGGQYQLVLPDGSKVWLNALSSIHYPTSFVGNERKVQITGEAYFEVVHNEKMPFTVMIAPTPGGKGGAAVQVLGTHFNVNGYDDEDAIKTTLLQGSVKVVNGEWSMVNGESAILKPGEQASTSWQSGESSKIKVQTVDVDAVMAWKNGLFHFENADIKTVMRQLARWYDVDIVYKGTTVKNDPLYVEISRNTNLSIVLKALETSGSARFSIEGKKIIVL